MNDINWTDILQTIAIFCALIFTGWELRSHTREQKFQSYLNVNSYALDLAKLMIENPILCNLHDYSATDWTKDEYHQLTSEEKVVVQYCDMLINLCETVWLAEQEGWLSGEWQYWKRWTDHLYQSPAFRWTLHWVENDYDETFLIQLRPQVRGYSSYS